MTTVRDLYRKLREIPKSWECWISNNGNSIQARSSKPTAEGSNNHVYVFADERPNKWEHAKWCEVDD